MRFLSGVLESPPRRHQELVSLGRTSTRGMAQRQTKPPTRSVILCLDFKICGVAVCSTNRIDRAPATILSEVESSPQSEIKRYLRNIQLIFTVAQILWGQWPVHDAT